MKINDISNEGLDDVKNWFLRRGVGGRAAAIKAMGSHLTKQQSAARSAAQEMQREKFKSDLATALKQAVESGLITGIVPESVNYTDFDKLLESKIITEAITVTDFMTSYVKNLTSKMKLTAQQEMTLNTLITSFSTNYRGPNSGLPPEADKLWSALQSIKSLQGSQKSKLGDFGYPAASTSVEVQGHKYSYDGTSWKDSSGNVIDVEDDIKTLNKKAYEERFATQRPPRAIPYASAMHGTQYKWTYDDSSDTWNGYPRNEPNPPVTSPIVVGNTDSRYAALNKAYHSQTGI